MEKSWTPESVEAELMRQIELYRLKGLIRAGTTVDERIVSEVREKATALSGLEFPEEDITVGRLPFVLVLNRTVADPETLIRCVEVNGRKAVEKMNQKRPSEFATIESVFVPSTDAYVVVDIDRGQATRNVAPDRAMLELQNSVRSPLTIDEGICVLIQYPEYLLRNNCYSLLGSRIENDKRVPAIWLNGKNGANPGRCWNGNPHAWLGSASCRARD